MHFLGLHGMTRRIYTYPDDLNFAFWNAFETAGSMLLGLSVLVFLWNVVTSLRRGEPAPDNPWDAPTLEWATPSPPEPWNFRVLPRVHSRYPLWEQTHPELMGGAATREDEITVAVAGREVAHPEAPDDRARAAVHEARHAEADAAQPHLPNPSFWPLVAAIGILLVNTGMLLKQFGPYWLPVLLLGAATLLVGVYRWAFQPLEG
jgi:hypothetical protein